MVQVGIGATQRGLQIGKPQSDQGAQNFPRGKDGRQAELWQDKNRQRCRSWCPSATSSWWNKVSDWKPHAWVVTDISTGGEDNDDMVRFLTERNIFPSPGKDKTKTLSMKQKKFVKEAIERLNQQDHAMWSNFKRRERRTSSRDNAMCRNGGQTISVFHGTYDTIC